MTQKNLSNGAVDTNFGVWYVKNACAMLKENFQMYLIKYIFTHSLT